MTSLLIAGGTIVDGVSPGPVVGRSILIESGRIARIGRREELDVPRSAEVLDAAGKYVIPGLMNANVHLLGDFRPENLLRYMDRYEDLIVEAAQVALANGVTTVFDTWGPRRGLQAVKSRIDAGEIPGSRIFCAGNIVGLDGPFSPDFIGGGAGVVSPALRTRLNSMWAEDTGHSLLWMSPAEVAAHVRAYVQRGIDFIKYAASQHPSTTGARLGFSAEAQAAIVAEAHRARITAQAHTHTVESLRIAAEAGCDLIQHPNMTGPVAIPAETLQLLARRRTALAVFPFTSRALDWLARHAGPAELRVWSGATADANVRALMRSGAPLVLATDGSILAPEALSDPAWKNTWVGLEDEDGIYPLATGHFVWLRAMQEKGMPPMEILRAATRNIAFAYGRERDLGTLEPGKIADLVVLDRDPLAAAENYRAIDRVIKDGIVVDRRALPQRPLLTQSPPPPTDEEVAYRRAI